MEKIIISVQVRINAPINKVWQNFTTPEDIVHWNNASDDWHTVRANNDLQVGGKFNYRMEAKDGSMGFDFEGVYDKVAFLEQINYTILGGRKVTDTFSFAENQTEVTVSFEAEDVNSPDLQQKGWQAILDNFKKYVEEN